jgi:hypothetical protein
MHIRGTHAFRTSQQSFGAVANQPFTASSGSMTPSTVHRDAGDDFLGGSSGNEEPVPPPLSTPPCPPVSTTSPSVSSFTSQQSKRKYSALGDGDSMSIKSSSLMSSQDKHQRGAGSAALHALSTKMDKMNETLRITLLMMQRPMLALTAPHSAGQKLPKAFRGSRRL